MRPSLISAVLCALAAPAVAQSNAELISNDAYTRSHDYDLVHQRIEVRNFDWDSTSFDGRVTTTLVALRPALDSVILDAGSRLIVSRIADGRGATLRSERHGDTLVVYPARPIAFHDTLRCVIDYHAPLENGKGLTFIQPEGQEHRPQQIWSQGEDHNNHFWFPTYDFPNDKMTWELVATVPQQYSVVSNGRLVADRKLPGGTHSVTWRQDLPSSTYLVSLIVAPLVKVPDRWHAIPVEYYVYHADSSRAQRLFAVTPDMIDVYSRLTGLPYPWAKYAQTTVADFFGGMENVSATTLVDWLPDERAYLDRPWYQWILTPHALGSATSDDLRQAVLDATGENLDGFWSEWVYGAGHPAFTVTAAYDSAARTLALSVKQTQRDSAPPSPAPATGDSTAPRYRTAAVFHMPLTIRVGTRGGDLVRRVQLTAREQTVSFPALAGPPTMVVFDDGNTILKELSFDQPTSWLATQLEHDADLWNREWVIEQLAQRPADTGALAALARTATSADYFLTRSQAAEALARFPAAGAATPLAAALGDTSAQVRRAAITALGRLGGARAAELARATWRTDPSYEVRAAALTALVAADSSARDSVVAWGLATASYQNVIQQAAYRVIAQTGDTGAIARVDTLLGSDRFPAHVLAALAARGNARALALLTSHLDDDRAYVRRWVLEAFRYTLPRQLAVERLKGVAGKLKYADTREEAEKTLQQLEKPGAEEE